MRLIDLSQPIFHHGPHCPVHPPIEIELMDRHDTVGWHTERIALASHTGSHLDAPLHKLPGARAIDGYPLEAFVGPAWIVDLRGSEADRPIGPDDLEKSLPTDLADAIVLLATGWGDRRASDDAWHYHSPFLAPAGAEWLASRGIRGVGIDHYSIGGSRDPDNSATHVALLSRNAWILEDLVFPAEVFTLPRPQQLWTLPINFRGFSGSFCRPVLAVGGLT